MTCNEKDAFTEIGWNFLLNELHFIEIEIKYILNYFMSYIILIQ